MTRSDDQINLAQQFADALEDAGHDVDTADLLDCLAVSGLMLMQATDRNVAVDAYFEHLERADA